MWIFLSLFCCSHEWWPSNKRQKRCFYENYMMWYSCHPHIHKHFYPPTCVHGYTSTSTCIHIYTNLVWRIFMDKKKIKLWLIECFFFCSDFDLFNFSCWNVIQPLYKLLQITLASFMGGGYFLTLNWKAVPTWGILKCVDESLLLYVFQEACYVCAKQR